MRRAIVPLLVCLLLLHAACAERSQQQQSPPAAPEESVQAFNRFVEENEVPLPDNMDQLPMVTPDVVRSAFERDPGGTDALYGGKWLKVRGRLHSGPGSASSGMHVYFLSLESNGRTLGCVFFGKKHEETLRALKQGQRLLLVGEYNHGTEASLPLVIGCTLLSAE